MTPALKRARHDKCSARISLLVVVAFALSLSCRSNREEQEREAAPETKTAPAPPEPARLYIPGGDDARVDLSGDEHLAGDVAFGVTAKQDAGLLRRGTCPADMVSVGGAFCIDRYEVSLVDSRLGRFLSPHYPPAKQSASLVLSLWTEKAATSRRALGRSLGLPEIPEFQYREDFIPRARSLPQVIPAGYLRRSDAEAACQSAGKRLCSREEWVHACRGEQNTRFPYGESYEDRMCNVYRLHHPASLLHGNSSRYHNDPRLGLTSDEDGPLLRETGGTSTCASHWGDDAIYDMVGNLDEWIDEPGGTFVGGFFSRATREGCAASIDSHSPTYWDYSLGTRCCLDADR